MLQLKSFIQYLKQTTLVEKIIFLLLIFYIPSILFPDFFLTWFALPTAWHVAFQKPWTLISYAFLHIRFVHLFSNLVILYFIGNLFLDFFNIKKFLFYNAVGIVLGSVFFLLYYLFTPPAPRPLIGFSTGLAAIFMGIVTKVPSYALKFRFIGDVKLWVLAVIWLSIIVFGLSGVDAGAAMAHFGGAISGFVLTLFFNEGNLLWSFNTIKKSKSNFQKVYRNQKQAVGKMGHKTRVENQKMIDLILEKISKHGYDALSKEEKEFLFNQNKH